MKAGLAIYSANLSGLVGFYTDVFGFVVMEADLGFALLDRDHFELVILETDVSRSKGGQNGTPVLRESTPLKPTFFLDDNLENVTKKVLARGGGMRKPKDWRFNGHLVCDGWDCEGNIFQLRLTKSS